MKLRIKGDALRLRLTRPEVAALAAGQTVREIIHFGLASALDLTYAIVASEEAPRLAASYRDHHIVVLVPSAMARQWHAGDEVAMEGVQSWRGGKLHILIEKDFACLRSGEDDPDAYPHPHGGQSC